MLVGYAPEEVKADLFPRLINLLGPEQPVGVRELALRTLRKLTGYDTLGYDPDHPGGKGLDAWKDHLRRNELKAPPPRPAGKAKAKAK
jgi:hypothetical protein